MKNYIKMLKKEDFLEFLRKNPEYVTEEAQGLDIVDFIKFEKVDFKDCSEAYAQLFGWHYTFSNFNICVNGRVHQQPYFEKPWIEFMDSKFGEEYKNDFLNHIKKYNKTQDEDYDDKTSEI